MKKEALEIIIEKTKELMNAPTCCSELQETAQQWLDAIGTDNEAAETEKYFAELKADIMPIDTLINFAGTAAGAQVFGAAKAKAVAAHAEEIKSAGSRYCDCPACAAVEVILEKLSELME